MTLAEKLSFITEEVGPIAKTKRPGDTVSFKYRSIDDVQNHLNPLLAEYGVTLQSKVLKCDLTMREFEKNNIKKVAYTAVIHLQVIFSDGTGQAETWEEVSMSEDYADKAVTQAMSMAYKYALLRKFCIVTADLTDPDARQPEYRETSHDSDRSGPKATEWLNEKTPQWDEAEEKLRSGEWTVDDVKAKWKVNKRQEETLASYVGKAAVKAPSEEKKVVAPAPASKKIKLTEEIQRNVFQLDLEYAGDEASFKAAINKDKDAKAYWNSEQKLKDGSVSLKMVTDIYEMDEAVTKHFTSIAKRKE